MEYLTEGRPSHFLLLNKKANIITELGNESFIILGEVCNLKRLCKDGFFKFEVSDL